MAESQPEQVLLTTEKSLELLVVDWLYRPFVYPYHGHKIITVVSGDTLEVNIEVRAVSIYRIFLNFYFGF